MPKINQEEYEVLKEKSSGGYEWIARDESGSCFIFELKPIKDNRYELWEWVGNTNIGKIFDSSLFQFIQWEDEEPYNIAELIKEYENSAEHVAHIANEKMKLLGKAWGELFKTSYESEETEVKKDLEWLKKEIDELFNGRSILIVGKSVVDEIFNQLDDPETLSQKWIDRWTITGETIKEWGFYKEKYIHVKNLQNLLVPKQEEIRELKEEITNLEIINEELKSIVENKIVIEKPVIPDFVADYIKWYKDNGINLPTTDREIIVNLINVTPEFMEYKKVQKWQKESGNTQKLIDAYRFGYKVEEQKYYLILPNIDNQGYKYTFIDMEGEFDAVDDKEHIAELGKKFTEQEIKDYDPRYLAFKVPVEEMEE